MANSSSQASSLNGFYLRSLSGNLDSRLPPYTMARPSSFADNDSEYQESREIATENKATPQKLTKLHLISNSSRTNLQPEEDIEFDLSDHELPEKHGARLLSGYKSDLLASRISPRPVPPILSPVTGEPGDPDEKNPEPFTSPAVARQSLKRKRSESPRQRLPIPRRAYTPLPLRKRVALSSGSKDRIPEDLAEEIERSGALRPKSTTEILEIFNTSLDRIRKEEGKDISEDELEADIVEEFERAVDAKRQRRLDKSDIHGISADLASRLSEHGDSKADNRESSPVVSENEIRGSREVPDTSVPRNELTNPREEAAVSEPFAPRAVEPTIVQASSLNESPLKHKKPKRGSSASLSGKYIREVLRKRRHYQPFPRWSPLKWGQLVQLLELGIPRHEIVNMPFVLEKLECTSREELERRIKFLDSRK